MFNDELNIEECSTIVKKLSICNFPFQCAHGRYVSLTLFKVTIQLIICKSRPSAIPIQLNTSSSIPHTIQRSINWDRFKR